MKRWVIIAAIIAVGYYLWKKERAARVAAETAAATIARRTPEDPMAAVKASTDSMLEKANALVASIRTDPGIGAALGLDMNSINRIIYNKDAYANIIGTPVSSWKDLGHPDPWAK